MKLNRNVFAGAAAVAALALLAAAPARAGDVYWSVGVQAAPGVVVGASNAPPVYVHPQPVYVQPQPVYVQPRPYPRSFYVQPTPVYVQPQPVYPVGYYYVKPGHRHWKHGPRGHGYGYGHRD